VRWVPSGNKRVCGRRYTGSIRKNSQSVATLKTSGGPEKRWYHLVGDGCQCIIFVMHLFDFNFMSSSRTGFHFLKAKKWTKSLRKMKTTRLRAAALRCASTAFTHHMPTHKPAACNTRRYRSSSGGRSLWRRTPPSFSTNPPSQFHNGCSKLIMDSNVRRLIGLISQVGTINLFHHQLKSPLGPLF